MKDKNKTVQNIATNYTNLYKKSSYKPKKNHITNLIEKGAKNMN